MKRAKQVMCLGIVTCALGLVSGQGCPPPPTNGDGGTGAPVYNNTTDRTNNGASYIGSDTCMACHVVETPDIVAQHILHGHNYKLNRVLGAAPSYPAEATRAGVPNPPSGKSWFDVTFVIGGYIRKGRFIDVNGYTMTDGVDGVNTQWNLAFPANGTEPGWTSYHADQVDPKPYGSSCFVCHTTGSQSLDENGGLHQDGKVGHEGTWAEAGVQCEACHGPGSKHIPNPVARDLFVDVDGTRCKECHDRPFNNGGGTILASGGFIKHHEQFAELSASGAHSSFKCTACHNPHAGPNYDRSNALVKECTDCHPNQSMALHSGKVLVRGDYTEQLGCQSCHMPYATKSATAATAAIVGDVGRMGDMKTHIFRINTTTAIYTSMFTADGKEVVKDAEGKAAVTLDFVCVRCHNGIGNAPEFGLPAVSSIASGMHQIQ